LIKDNERKYELKFDKIKNILFAKVFGSFTPTDANDFLHDYLTNVKTFDAKQCELIFDCKKLNITGTDIKTGVDMTILLKACIEQYKKDGFKKVTFNCDKNLILKMQLSRLSKQVGLPNFETI
jgi:hypothetical protein